MSELGPVSQGILDYVNQHFDYIGFYRLSGEVTRKTGAHRSSNWYWRRLAALAMEGRIEVEVHRQGDEIDFRFRRLQYGE